MFNIAIISTTNIVCVLFIKAQYVKVLFVQTMNEVGVLDNKQELCGCLPQSMCKSFLVKLRKIFSLIIREISIIRWIEEHKISFG